MRAHEFITEITIDNKGWGQTPRNIDVDYFGVAVTMKPSVFLQLAHHLHIGPEERKSIDAMIAHHQSGGSFGAPTLEIAVPDEWMKGDLSQCGKILSHEGRHRMNAQMEIEGDVPIETHIFLYSPHVEWRSRKITADMMARLNTELVSEAGQKLQGPFF